MSADYLREHDGYRESEIVHFLMEMEDAGFLRPVLIDGTAYVMPVQANLEDGIQEWAEKERDWRFKKIGEEEYLRWKASYEPAGAQRRIASGGRQQPFRLGQSEDGPRADGRGAGEIAERERPQHHSLCAGKQRR